MLKQTTNLLTLSFLILTGCAAPQRISHPLASLQDQETVKSFNIPEGQARVYFFLGYLRMYDKKIQDMDTPTEIFINDKSLGIIGNKSEIIAVDLYPRVYEFKWSSLEEKGAWWPNPTVLKVTLNEKSQTFLEAIILDTYSATKDFLFGVVGALASSHTRFLAILEQNPQKGREAIFTKNLISLNTQIKDSVKSME